MLNQQLLNLKEENKLLQSKLEQQSAHIRHLDKQQSEKTEQLLEKIRQVDGVKDKLEDVMKQSQDGPSLRASIRMSKLLHKD